MENLRERVRRSEMTKRPIYYLSDRLEAYEIQGDIRNDEAARIGRLSP